jgi:hypothetical protein
VFIKGPFKKYVTLKSVYKARKKCYILFEWPPTPFDPISKIKCKKGTERTESNLIPL